MNISNLQSFTEVARRGSIAGAARAMACDPSAVSRNLAALEAELGIRLFERTTRRLELTEAGQRYLRRIEPIMDELAAAQDEMRGLVGRPQGRLRVTASSAYGQTVVAPLIMSFRRDFPEVKLDLILTDAVIDLVAERIDVALRLGRRPSGNLIAARLATTTMRLVADPAYLRSAPPIRCPGDIASHPCLVSSPHPEANWTFQQPGGAEKRISVIGHVATSNTLVIRRCARDGLGVALLADWLVSDDIASGRLSVVLPDWKATTGGVETGVWIVYPTRSLLPLKTRAFIDHLRSHMGLRRRAYA